VTANELQMLICGIGIGAQSMALWHMALDIRDTRRTLAESRRARRRSAADHYLNSLRLYRLQQRTEVRP
jgi:biotin-(acetyl-CoA carboxylase) ligase